MKKFILAAIFGGLGVSAPLLATPVVQNHSFQTPASPPGGFTINSVPSWTASGFSPIGMDNYAFGVDTASSVGPGADGTQYFYGDGKNASETLTQDLGVSFSPNTTYTVDLLGADRPGCCGGSGIVFGLESSTSGMLTGATEGLVSLTDEVAAQNTFVAASVAASANNGSNIFSFTTGNIVPAGDIVAFIGSDGNFEGNGRINADDFVLTVTPEPASLSLLAIGGVGLLTWRRRT